MSKRILVIWHDPVPKQIARRESSPESGNERYHYTSDSGDIFTAVQLKNWFKLVTPTKTMKSLQDFTNIRFSSKVDEFLALSPSSYDAVVFVKPLYMYPGQKVDIEFLFSECRDVFSNINYSIVHASQGKLNDYGFVTEFKYDKEVGLSCSNLYDEYCNYLSYRMTSELCEQLNCKVGLSVPQYHIMEWLTSQHRSADMPSGRLRFEYDRDFDIDVQVDSGSIFEYMFNGTKPHTVDQTLDSVTKDLMLVDFNNLTIPETQKLHEDHFYGDLIFKHVPEQKGGLYDKLVKLFSLGFIGSINHVHFNKSGGITPNVLTDANREYLLGLFPDLKKLSGTNASALDGAIYCDLSRSPSELLEIDNSLVDLYLDIRDHYTNSICFTGIDPKQYGTLAHASIFTKQLALFYREKLNTSPLMYQGRFKYNSIPSDFTHRQFSKVERRYEPAVKSVIGGSYGSASIPLDVANFSKEIARLLSKRYITITQGGGYALTDFGAALFAMSRRMFKKAIDFSEEILRSEETVRMRDVDYTFASYLEQTTTRSCKPLLTKQFKVKGKQKTFNLIFKNRSGKKSIYWKSGSLTYGVLARYDAQDNQLELQRLRKLKYEKQDALGLNVFHLCSCGSLTASRKFDTKSLRSYFRCPICKAKAFDYYLNVEWRKK